MRRIFLGRLEAGRVWVVGARVGGGVSVTSIWAFEAQGRNAAMRRGRQRRFAISRVLFILTDGKDERSGGGEIFLGFVRCGEGGCRVWVRGECGGLVINVKMDRGVLGFGDAERFGLVPFGVAVEEGVVGASLVANRSFLLVAGVLVQVCGKSVY